MKTRLGRRLGIVIVAIEIASIAGMLLLAGRTELPSTLGVVLVFLLPIIFGLHVAEEFIFPGGGPEWFTIYRPQYAEAHTESYFFRVNAIPLVLVTLASFGAFTYIGGSFSFWGIRAWLVLMSMLAINGIDHIRGAIKTRRYSPGMATSIALYFPLAIVSFAYLLRGGAVDVVSAVVCFIAGFFLQPVLNRIKSRNIEKAV